jgi:hypothetical protein
MNRRLTVEELEARWEKTLQATQSAALKHSRTFRRLKSLADEIVSAPIDINDYFPVVEQMVECLETLDPGSQESIFGIFKGRIKPSSVWQVRMFRMECRDLLAHLHAFEKWRRDRHHLRMVK